MKKYYQLMHSIQKPWCIALDPKQGASLDEQEISFLTGHSINEKLPTPLKFYSDSKLVKRPPHFLEGDSVLVVSSLFIKALEAAGVDNFQTFPAVVHSRDASRDFTDYFALNVIGVYDAIDPEKSIGDEIMGGDDEVPAMTSFHTVVFSAKKLKPEPLMFRIPENESMLFVNQDVLDALDKTKPPEPERWGVCLDDIDVT